MESQTNKTRKEYYQNVREMGKKEYTLLKMLEYGFWPKDLPTPYERQSNETEEDFLKRRDILNQYDDLAEKISDLCDEKKMIHHKLLELQKEYNQTWDYDKIKKDISKQIMEESIKRREERKKLLAEEKKKKTERWNRKKAEQIVFIGKGYSSLLSNKNYDENKLQSYHLPVIKDDKELASFLDIEYKELRFLAYHRDVVYMDHYHHYSILKKNGKERSIAAPKGLLKDVQRKILHNILENIPLSAQTHGFTKDKSIVTGAKSHTVSPFLLINMDIENFFPTITFERVRGMFCAFGYSPYISSLLAMLCTYCERMPIEVKGKTAFVKTSSRILPQGSPASPMITNIICRRLDHKLSNLSSEYGCNFTRYADDLSFSFTDDTPHVDVNRFIFHVHRVVEQEGFKVNNSKTRYLRNNNRQSITGIVINNEEIGVPKIWIKKMRAAIHNARKQMGTKSPSKHQVHEIAGMVSWLKSVNPIRYQKIIADGENLLNDISKA